VLPPPPLLLPVANRFLAKRAGRVGGHKQEAEMVNRSSSTLIKNKEHL